MARHEIKRNDNRPYWPITLTFDDGSIVPLNGATVRFITQDSSGQKAIDATAVVTDGVKGEVEWRPGSDVRDAFLAAYSELYGGRPEDRPIELESVRVVVSCTGDPGAKQPVASSLAPGTRVVGLGTWRLGWEPAGGEVPIRWASSPDEAVSLALDP